MLRLTFQFYGASIEEIIDDILLVYIVVWLVVYSKSKKSETSILIIAIKLVTLYLAMVLVDQYLIPLINFIVNFWLNSF